MQDLTQTWLNNFVDFAHTVDQVQLDNLLYLADKEKAVNLYKAAQQKKDRIYPGQQES